MRNWFSDLRRPALGALALFMCPGVAGAAEVPLDRSELAAAYAAVAKKSILDLQQFRHEWLAERPDEAGRLRLIDLSPEINAWFLLGVADADGGRERFYHLENRDRTGASLALEDGERPVLLIDEGDTVIRCAPWVGQPSELERAASGGLPFAPLCAGRLFLRNKVSGSRTSLEVTTDFLRDNVWGGEAVVRFVRDNFFKDSHAETARELGVEAAVRLAAGPPPAALSTPDDERPVAAVLHEFGLDGTEAGRMTLGLWYPVAGLDGVFVSAVEPRYLAKEILEGPGPANRLDRVESRASDIFVAFDLSRYGLGFSLGTDHPRLDWSPRPPGSVRPRGLPGPDGVSKSEPLIRLGMVSPDLTERTVATFTAGFKRRHGAFKWGPFAGVNMGSHYGFIEEGVVFSKLQPDLSTIYVLDDGTIGMKSWTEADNALLPRIRYARQNGVPLVVTDPATGLPTAGEFVPQWGPGNWSGSAEAELRTLRAGACMIETAGTRYLVYGYFSTATPSAMARVFQAYGCGYAMLLDMNALEHTYLALYVRHEGSVHVEHLVPGMSLIDRKAGGGTVIPRFLGYPDNRDVFYLFEKGEG